MTSVMNWAGQNTTYAYDTAGQLVTMTLPNGVATVNTYDSASRLTRLAHLRGADVLGQYTAMYVRDDTPTSEPRYRARFYFHPNGILIPNSNAQNILVGHSGSTTWDTISNAVHYIEVDWTLSSRVRVHTLDRWQRQ